MAARALRESFDQRGVPNVVMDLLDFSSDLFKWSYSDVYAFISEHSHLACRIVYDLTNKDREESVVLRLYEKISLENVKKFMRYIAENEPKKCVCTHFFPLNVLSRMKAEGLYNGELYSVITDYGLHKMWINDGVDRYFIPSDMVREGLLRSGVPEEKIAMSGIPVLPKYARIPNRKRDFSKERLAVLFISSSIHNALAIDILKELERTDRPLDVTVVTGRNYDLVDDLEQITFTGPMRLNIRGFVDNLDELMAENDLLITKPGGLTVSEALCAAVPMILVNPIPKQETNNSAYIQSKGAGILARTAENVAGLVDRFFEDRSTLSAMETAASSIAFPEAASAVASGVMEGCAL
jgi:processive 1,2-diacylglycerol beta-glucosyltransferase